MSMKRWESTRLLYREQQTARVVRKNRDTMEMEKQVEVREMPRHAQHEWQQMRVESRPQTRGKCNYMYKGQDYYPMPVVDLKGRLHDEDPETRAAIVQQLSEAGKVGAFRVVNHGIDQKLLVEFRQSVNAFFALPLEEKVKCSKTLVPGCYRPLGYQGQFSNLTQETPVVQRREVFEFQGSPRVENPALVPWPESLPCFRVYVEVYARELGRLTKWMCEALAEGLGLRRDAFLKQIGGDNFHQQIITCLYPMVEKQPKEIVNPSSLGFGAHSDLPFMNIVLEDDCGGPQLYHDDQWISTKPIPEGITFYLGDPMECMSNGNFHAMVHRVLAPKDRSRFACVATFEPIDKEGTLIQPVPELVERSGLPAKYVAYNFWGRVLSLCGKSFNPVTMTKQFMVTEASVLDSRRDFSYKDGVFCLGSRPLGSVTEGY